MKTGPVTGFFRERLLKKVVNSSKAKLIVYTKNEAFVKEIKHTLLFLF